MSSWFPQFYWLSYIFDKKSISISLEISVVLLQEFPQCTIVHFAIFFLLYKPTRAGWCIPPYINGINNYFHFVKSWERLVFCNGTRSHFSTFPQGFVLAAFKPYGGVFFSWLSKASFHLALLHLSLSVTVSSFDCVNELLWSKHTKRL